MGTERIDIFSFTLNETFAFDAYITSFNDAYTSNWKTENVFGRMDAIATFQNTARKITMEFDVPSSDVLKAVKNFDAVNKLISALYPVYNNANQNGIATIASPPLFRVKYANLVTNAAATGQGLLCYFDSGFTFSPDFSAGVFNTGEEIYPKLFKASLGFTVLHEHPLGVNGATNRLRLNPEPENIKSFPYNMGKFSEVTEFNSSFQQTFNTDNKSLADYLNQAEEQRKQQAATAAGVAVRRTQDRERGQAENKIQAAIGQTTSNNNFDLSKATSFSAVETQDGTTIFFVTAEQVGVLTEENTNASRKAQEQLYKAVATNKKVVLTVIGARNNQTVTINGQ